MLRIHDTALGRVTELSQREPGKVSIYVCGPTVYDLPHIGHGRAFLVYDVLRRYLEWSGVSVTFVSNVTDIDDKIIDRAAATGRSADEVAKEFEVAHWEAMDSLGIRRPDADPHATAYVDGMVALVADLIERGAAYETASGVYFSVESVADYGLLARQSLDSLRSGARVEVGEEKRSPVDFALWKKAKLGEPAWESPWGPGRPGWHTECVVMSLDLLGEDFDLHTGGLDLQFPHHENERAQAVALGRSFSRHWMHHAFVEVGGQKMSKSLGNFTSLTDLLARHDPRAYRLLVLQAHYRSPLEVTPETLEQAERSLARLDDFARRLAGVGPDDADGEALARFREAMDDDLDTPRATALVFDLVRRSNAASDAGDDARARALGAAVLDMLRAVGMEPKAAAEEADAEAADLVARRDAARAGGDYTAADALRAELQARGWVVEDTPGGTRIHR